MRTHYLQGPCRWIDFAAAPLPANFITIGDARMGKQSFLPSVDNCLFESFNLSAKSNLWARSKQDIVRGRRSQHGSFGSRPPIQYCVYSFPILAQVFPPRTAGNGVHERYEPDA